MLRRESAVTGTRSPGAPELVLLPGWSFDANVFAPAARIGAGPRLLAPPELTSSQTGPGLLAPRWREALMSRLPPVCDLMGWSLGGQIAMAIAANFPLRVRRLVLVATTPCFVRRRGWNAAMPRAPFEEFARRLAADPSGTLRHFAGLVARGDRNERAVLRGLRKAATRGAPDIVALRAGLDALREIDLRKPVRMIHVPTLVVHGARDRLVPVAAGRWLASRIAGAKLVTFPGAAHAPFLSDRAGFTVAVGNFLAAA
jgi:pimeloyl-[acyl-carrier protein] methyl ester esterase